MADLPPQLNVDAVAGEISSLLDLHRGQVAPSLSAPATTPMFTREQNGAVVDRNGRVVIAAPAPPGAVK
jgi:hypothetical protein